MAWRPCDYVRPAGRMEISIMPGVGAQANVGVGVLTGDQLYSQPAAPTKMSMSLKSPNTWATIWVVLAVLYLVGIYVGSIRIAGSE